MNNCSVSGPACAQVRGMQQPNAGSTGAQDPDHAFNYASCIWSLRLAPTCTQAGPPSQSETYVGSMVLLSTST